MFVSAAVTHQETSPQVHQVHTATSVSLSVHLASGLKALLEPLSLQGKWLSSRWHDLCSYRSGLTAILSSELLEGFPLKMDFKARLKGAIVKQGESKQRRYVSV